MEEDGDENGPVDLERALDETSDALLSNKKLVPAMVVRKEQYRARDSMQQAPSQI